MKIEKAGVKQQFEASARAYNQFAGMQREIVSDSIAMLPNKDSERSSLIDLGCGTGFGLSALAAKYSKAELVGVDIAHSMLREASIAEPRATLISADLEYLPLCSNRFDLALTTSAVQWCDLSKVLTEVNRVLRPGGRLLLATFGDGTLSEWRKLWRSELDKRFLALSEFESTFSPDQWVDIEISSRVYTQGFQSFEAAISSIKKLGASGSSETHGKGLFGRQRYRAIKALVEERILNEGEFTLPYVVFFAMAQKR